jgi:hypothetical protein
LWNPDNAKASGQDTQKTGMERDMEMTLTNCHGGSVSGMGDGVIRVAICAIVAVIALLAARATAAAQTSDANAAVLSSIVQLHTPDPMPEKTRSTANTQVLEKPSLFFPDLAHSGKALSASEKFRLSLTSSVSPAAFLGSAWGAGLGQAIDSPAGYGQGAKAYGQRFGASMAKRASGNLIGTYFLSAVLHDDPRFFVRGDGGLKQSIKYAMRRLVVVRKDDGGEAFNWPGVVAPLAAAGLANAYLPDPQRTAGYTLENYGWSLAASAGVNLLKEYWPTITRKVLVPMGISHESDKP